MWSAMTPFSPAIGYLQGGLAPQDWREDLSQAQTHGFQLIEWALRSIVDDPLMSRPGRQEIRRLARRQDVRIVALRLFAPAPFFKVSGPEADRRFGDLARAAVAARELDIPAVVLPLTGEARIASPAEARRLSEGLASLGLVAGLPKILLESDFGPDDLAALMAPLPDDLYGVSYDIGLSARLGWDPAEELAAYGRRIGLVHVSEPLGDPSDILRRLAGIGWRGALILNRQPLVARARLQSWLAAMA
jgi:hexulose-6-phosphate isomerase